MSDEEERERRGLARLVAAVGKSDGELADERAIIAAFRARARDLRGEARVREIETFLVELVEMKVRWTRGMDREELRADLYEEIRTNPRMHAAIARMLEPSIEA